MNYIQIAKDIRSRHKLISAGDTVVISFQSNSEWARYHYFNINGVCKAHTAAVDTLAEYVKAGHINSGWLIAHDGSYHMDNISKLAMQKRVHGWEINFHIQELQKETEELYNNIAEVHMGIRNKANKEI